MKNIKFHNPPTFAERMYIIHYRVNQKYQELFPGECHDWKIMASPIENYIHPSKRKYKNLRVVK
jgi:hypothetical protein